MSALPYVLATTPSGGGKKSKEKREETQSKAPADSKEGESSQGEDDCVSMDPLLRSQASMPSVLEEIPGVVDVLPPPTIARRIDNAFIRLMKYDSIFVPGGVFLTLAMLVGTAANFRKGNKIGFQNFQRGRVAAQGGTVALVAMSYLAARHRARNKEEEAEIARHAPRTGIAPSKPSDDDKPHGPFWGGI